MNEKSTRTDIDEFVDRQSPELRCTARELVDIIRNQLEDADERVEAGKAIFSKN